MSQLKRGDKVKYKGEILYFQPMGSCCYLYTNKEDVGDVSKKKYAPSKNSVERIEDKLENDSSSNESESSDEDKQVFSLSTKMKDLNLKTEYVYIGKDIEDGRRLYKIGRTANLAQRLKHYKTGQPSFEFIIKIQTENSRKLEKQLHDEYVAHKRENEIYENLNLNEVRKKLVRWGFTENNDGIFI